MSVNRSGSGNSGQRSKRSLSNSNPSSKTKQKTLGMAWEANSLSSSRASTVRTSAFSSFGSYMAEKNRKLHNQFDAVASSSSNGLFHGVSIFVDGFTIPSAQELKGYMLQYGGRFENYFSRRHVTHIICSNLPDSKVKNLRSFSRGLPVVKPAWILDSVVANKVLSWVPYQLDQLTTNQPKLSDFFALRNCPDTGKILDTAVYESNLDVSLDGGTRKDEQVEDPMNSGMGMDVQFDDTEYETEDANNDGDMFLGLRMGEPSTSGGREDGNNFHYELPSSPKKNSDPDSNDCLSNQNRKESMSSAAVGSSSRHHSTFGDPNFVEKYFKSSRLHFIGTWRNRYRKRFPSDFQCKPSHSNPSDFARISTIIHIDMDCFFVSVVIRNRPDLHDKPVAVCHSDSPKGTAEISSANYPARNFGVKAGMFVRDAKALCSHLVIMPYNFQAYEEVADQFYDILHKHSKQVEALSCDEAFLDVTDSDSGDPELLASKIRKEIFEATACSASAGIAANMLMARLATRAAKPDGQCYIPTERVDDFLNQLPIKALPGIGHVLEQKLKQKDIETCGQLRLISKDCLRKDFGIKTGEMLWNYSRGVDNRMVGMIRETKSIGAEVNWGVRFKDLEDTRHFLLNLCKEVSLRLKGCGVQGRNFTLKIKKRRKDADEPIKFMGCGDCDNLSRSTTVPNATDEVQVLQRITTQLFGSFNLDVKEIRGVGLQVSKLENADASKLDPERNSLQSWLSSASRTAGEPSNTNSLVKERTRTNSVAQRNFEISGRHFADPSLRSSHNTVSAPPPLSSLDVEVVESLPPELFSELNDSYGGKLVNFIAKVKRSSTHISGHLNPSHVAKSTIDHRGGLGTSDVIPAEKNTDKSTNEARSNNQALGVGENNIMPYSLSQIDTSVLHQLPKDMRVDILAMLPAHRNKGLTSDAVLGPVIDKSVESLDTNTTGRQATSSDHGSNSNLWIGNPPKWIDIIKASNFLILNTLAEMYHLLGSPATLSPILQHAISRFLCLLDDEYGDEAISFFCELLKQYINLKIQSDIEEVYVCFRLLKRFTHKSKFFSEAYDMVFPYLQASVEEYYGGNLHIPPNE